MSNSPESKKTKASRENVHVLCFHYFRDELPIEVHIPAKLSVDQAVSLLQVMVKALRRDGFFKAPQSVPLPSNLTGRRAKPPTAH